MTAMKPSLETIPVPTDRSLVFKVDPSIWPGWHYHPEYELNLILEGVGDVVVGDAIGHFEPGCMHLLGPNLPHSFQLANPPGATNKGKVLVIQFLPDRLGSVLLEKPEFAHIRHFLHRGERGLKFGTAARDSVQEMLLAMIDQSPFERLVGLLSVLDRLAISQQTDPLAGVGFSPSLSGAAVQRIDKVVQHVMRNIDAPLTLDEVARLVHMSPRSFCRFFKKNTGKTFVQYVNELRIGKSCRLLADTDFSVAEICFRAGFQNLSHFNRQFLRIKEMTPRQYRRTLRDSL